MTEVRRTERGWAGHFCGADRCRFRRNTLLQCGKARIAISTVGRMMDASQPEHSTQIGWQRFYETMAFHAEKFGGYWDANVHREVHFKSKWAIPTIDGSSDLEADKMHEAVVAEIARRLLNGERFEDTEEE